MSGRHRSMPDTLPRRHAIHLFGTDRSLHPYTQARLSIELDAPTTLVAPTHRQHAHMASTAATAAATATTAAHRLNTGIVRALKVSAEWVAAYMF